MCAHNIYISFDDYRKFINKYDANYFPSQRFGQAFYNFFFNGTDEWQRRPWPELFYETNRNTAENMIKEQISKTYQMEDAYERIFT